MQNLLSPVPLTLTPQPPSIAFRIETKSLGPSHRGPWLWMVFSLFDCRAFAYVFPSAKNALHALVPRVPSSGNQLNHGLLQEAFPCSLMSSGLSLMSSGLSHTSEVMQHLFVRFFAQCLSAPISCGFRENGLMLSPGQCLAHSRGSLNTCRTKN